MGKTGFQQRVRAILSNKTTKSGTSRKGIFFVEPRFSPSNWIYSRFSVLERRTPTGPKRDQIGQPKLIKRGKLTIRDKKAIHTLLEWTPSMNGASRAHRRRSWSGWVPFLVFWAFLFQARAGVGRIRSFQARRRLMQARNVDSRAREDPSDDCLGSQKRDFVFSPRILVVVDCCCCCC